MPTKQDQPSFAGLENPLATADYKRINEALYKLNKFVQYCSRAEAAGVDCGDRMQAAEFLREQLEARKRTFFPGKP